MIRSTLAAEPREAPEVTAGQCDATLLHESSVSILR